jgi:hypothetical protein
VCLDLHILRAAYGLFATLERQEGVLENGAHTAIPHHYHCNSCAEPVDESTPEGDGMFVALTL